MSSLKELFVRLGKLRVEEKVGRLVVPLIRVGEKGEMVGKQGENRKEI